MAVYQRGSRGRDITRLQILLKELGLYTSGLDDIFGPGVESAVRTFQQRRGLRADGVVDDDTWSALFGEPSPRLAAIKDKPAAYRSLTLTAGFETSTAAPDCFAGLAGNFDGQGISFGVLQWNLGQGTLQPLLKQLATQHPKVMQEAFGEGLPVIQQMLAKDRAGQLAWAGTIQAANGRSLAEPWRSRFKALGRAAECQELQVQGAKERFDRALQMCKTYGLWSERGAALMFDIVVQNGSIKEATRDQIFTDFQKIRSSASDEEQEVERMRVVANRRAEAANLKFVEDVRRRKLTIAEGVGVVHGTGYDLERQFNLRLVPLA